MNSFLAVFVPVFELPLRLYAIASPDDVRKCLERERGVFGTLLVRMMLLKFVSGFV